MLHTQTAAASPSTLAGRHTLGLSILLHLAPGLLTGAVYYLLALPVARLGLPSVAALMAAALLVMIPFELGVIAWAARKSGPQPLAALIPYRQPLPFWRFLVLVLAIVLGSGLVFTLLGPLTGFLQGLFQWLPPAMVLNLGMEGVYDRGVLIWITALNALLVAFIAPLVEEYYFRGFLLPRMPERLGRWTPLFHSFLFAAYHVWSPWMLVTRTAGVLPLIYAVQRSRSIYPAIVAHCLINFIDVIAMVAFLANS